MYAKEPSAKEPSAKEPSAKEPSAGNRTNNKHQSIMFGA